MFETRELGSELGQQLKVARLYSEQPQGRIVQLCTRTSKPLIPRQKLIPAQLQNDTYRGSGRR